MERFEWAGTLWELTRIAQPNDYCRYIVSLTV